ncbi:MAG TPA: cation acetate symporter, partial [Streptosporangiaceae bacterium]|nr:cation acetate symporter [Streptosporangiaceae bacterium]
MSPFAVPAIVFITVVTVVIGAFGYKISRNTSDFLVASRTVSPRLNASAISGEYLSAASFLGVAGLIMVNGVDMLWYPVGFTAGYLAMLLYVAAPLRRSGAYTLPDFAEARLRSSGVRTLATGFVVLIGWLYLVPQLQGAGLTLTTVTGAPSWVGAVVVGAVVTLNTAVGGMRSITFVQAFQYWVKLTAIAFPAMVLLAVWFHRDGTPSPARQPLLDDGDRWLVPLTGLGAHPLFTDYSLILATFLGTMGLPHVLVRFYTNPDGRAARTTTLVVLGLLGIFYLFPTVYGALGRVYVPQLLQDGNADAVVLVLPDAALGGLVAAGAFAAFLSTASGLLVSVSGVLSTDLFGRWSGGHGSVRDFRRAAMVAGLVPLLLALQAGSLGLSTVVGLAFAVAASTFCPLLVLGIWWRRLTPIGAGAGLLVGGGLSGIAVLVTVLGPPLSGWPGALLAEPAAWTVPISFAVMVLGSLATQRQVPAD